MYHDKRPIPKMKHRPQKRPRYTRMTRGWGYLCPRCRDVIMFDRLEQIYFCWRKTDCGFSEPKSEYAATLKDIRTTLSRGEAANDMALQRIKVQREADKGDYGVVYYIKFRDVIKIGTTADPRGRFSELPWEEVLALEPGGFALERMRHLQFRDGRVRNEWFEPTDELIQHVADTRDKYAEWMNVRFENPPTLPWKFGDVSIPGFATILIG